MMTLQDVARQIALHGCCADDVDMIAIINAAARDAASRGDK